MSTGFLTWSAWQQGEIGYSEKGLPHRFEQSEPPLAGNRVVHHDHHGVEEAVDGGAEGQEVAEHSSVIGEGPLEVGLDGLAGHLCFEV